MNTDPDLYLALAEYKNRQLREKLNLLKSLIDTEKDRIEKISEEIQKSVGVEYTNQLAFFKLNGSEYEFVNILDENNMPEELGFEWDVVLPLPAKESLPEINGY